MAISLDDMSALVRTLIDSDEKIKDLEGRVKEAKEKSRVLREETIPSALQELGISDLTLDTGQKLSVKQDVYASIPNNNKHEAFSWLNTNGFGGLIKVEVITSYSKGEANVAKALFEELHRRGLKADLKESVHPQTLKAFLKEQMSQGVNLPLDIFGARPIWTAKISNR